MSAIPTTTETAAPRWPTPVNRNGAATSQAPNAARVTGIDVQEAVLAKAAVLVRDRGLAERIALRRVEPDGRLPFADGSLDAVFSKETIVYVGDKAALLREAYRVLRPGGWLLVSDWYSGGRLTDAALGFWREAAGVHTDLVPLEEQAALLARAGFVDVAATDRNAWYREASVRDARRMRTTERARIEAALGEAGAGNLVERARMTAAMVGRDWLRAGHLRGRKPG